MPIGVMLKIFNLQQIANRCYAKIFYLQLGGCKYKINNMTNVIFVIYIHKKNSKELGSRMAILALSICLKMKMIEKVLNVVIQKMNPCLF